MSDFKIQRGTKDAVNVQTVTINAGTDYTAPASLSKAFIRITAVNAIGSQTTNGNSTLQPALSWVYITNPQNLLTSITFSFGLPAIGLYNNRIYWEIVEYIGASGGANEFIVRGQETFSPVTGTTDHGSTLTGVVTNAKMFCWLTGATSIVNGGDSPRTLYTLDWDATANQRVIAQRAGTSGATAAISYAAVEFTGSNWSNVQRIAHTIAAANTQEDVTITSVGALSRAFTHSQLRSDTTTANGVCAEAWLSAPTTASFKMGANFTPSSNNVVVLWIITNNDTSSGKATATRYSIASTTDGTDNNTLSPAVAATNNTSLTDISASSDSTGAAGVNRMMVGMELTSTTNVVATHIAQLGNMNYRFATYEWPDATIGVATHLGITSQPTTAITQRAFSVAVTALDSTGATASSFTGNVTLTFSVSVGVAVITGTLVQAAVAGVATFTGLSPLNSDGATFAFTAAASGLTGASSTNIVGAVRSNDSAVTST